MKVDNPFIVPAGDVNVIWTPGKTIVDQIVQGDMLYTQGFHQPLVVLKDTPGTLITITAFPNPVRTTLYVSFKTEEDRAVTLELFDNNGQHLQRRRVNTFVQTTNMELGSYPAGNYFLVVKDSNGKILKTIKILKSK